MELALEPHGEKRRAQGMRLPRVYVRWGRWCASEPQGWLYTKTALSDCEEIIEKRFCAANALSGFRFKKDGTAYPKQDEIPFYQKQTRLSWSIAARLTRPASANISVWRVWARLKPRCLTARRTTSSMRSQNRTCAVRGGGGFPAGRKWSQGAPPIRAGEIHVCNGDEGDPGAFMDRSVMEGDPHRMPEGMMIVGLPGGAGEGYTMSARSIRSR